MTIPTISPSNASSPSIQSTQSLNNEQNLTNQTTLTTKSQSNHQSNFDQELELERPKINMLDFISGMSKAIHLLLYQRDSTLKSGLEGQESTIKEENQTSTTQSISIFRPLKVNSKIPPEGKYKRRY